MKYLAVFCFACVLLISSCSDGDSGPGGAGNADSGPTSGTLSLSGNETNLVGTQLNAGYVGAVKGSSTEPDYAVIVDSGSTVNFTAPNILTPSLGDPNNGFVLVVTDATAVSGYKTISMSIWVSGTKYDFVCNYPAGVFVDCGGDATINLEINSRMVTFAGLVVENSDTGEYLMLDGALSW